MVATRASANVLVEAAMPKEVHPLLALAVIVFLSLVVAAVLFRGLSSTGIVKSSHLEFGGAAAGFFVALWGLMRWYERMEQRRTQLLQLGPLAAQEFGDRRIEQVLGELRELHEQYLKVLPVNDLFPGLRELFNRNTFTEKIKDCVSEDWITRLRAACLTEKVLRAYETSVSKRRFATPDPQRFYDALLREVHGYCQNMTGLFEGRLTLEAVEQYLDSAEALKQHVPKPQPKDKLDREVVERCDTNLKKISDLWESAGFEATLFKNSKANQ